MLVLCLGSGKEETMPTIGLFEPGTLPGQPHPPLAAFYALAFEGEVAELAAKKVALVITTRGRRPDGVQEGLLTAAGIDPAIPENGFMTVNNVVVVGPEAFADLGSLSGAFRDAFPRCDAYTQCRSTVCRGYDTHGIVQSKIGGEPSLVSVAVPIVVNAPTSDYVDVGDEVGLTKE
jgi:hypothetical protein